VWHVLRGFLEFASINLNRIYPAMLYIIQYFLQMAASARKKGKGKGRRERKEDERNYIKSVCNWISLDCKFLNQWDENSSEMKNQAAVVLVLEFLESVMSLSFCENWHSSAMYTDEVQQCRQAASCREAWTTPLLTLQFIFPVLPFNCCMSSEI